jgi:1,6-anhydro-N-acetylmuramate kinase
MMPTMRTRLIAGCMTGTSIDAIDAVLVRVEGEGLGMRVTPVRSMSKPLGSLGKLLRVIASQKRRPIGNAARYRFMLGFSHALLLRDLIGDDAVDFVVVHGQTVYHELNVTWQIIDPHPIVAELGVPVAFDLRGADMAAGGCGAPITPLADHVLYRDAAETRAVVNLGGFANMTWLPATARAGADALASIRAGDVCACNLLLDYIARRWLKEAYDAGGRAAARGVVHPEAEELLSMILQSQSELGRSLGTGHDKEAINWARSFQNQCTGDDLCATACSVIGRIVAERCGESDRIIVAGGGSRNDTLVDAIRAHRGKAEVVTSDAMGVPAGDREAIAMAVLGALSQDGIPLTLPQVTGRTPAASPKPCWIHP